MNQETTTKLASPSLATFCFDCPVYLEKWARKMFWKSLLIYYRISGYVCTYLQDNTLYFGQEIPAKNMVFRNEFYDKFYIRKDAF